MVYLERIENVYDLNNNRHNASTPPTISRAYRKEQKVGEICMTSDLIGLYICCTCELSSSSSSSPASNSNEPVQSFVTEEIQAFWEHVRNEHRSPGRNPQECEIESSRKIKEDLPRKIQDHNKNNGTPIPDVIVIEDDDYDNHDKMEMDCFDGNNGNTKNEETLNKIMGDKKELLNGNNEAAVTLDQMITEAFKEDNIATHDLESSTANSNECNCSSQSRTRNDESKHENINPNVRKENDSIRGNNINENMEIEIILIDDDEEESYDKSKTNNNNSISTPLLKQLLDTNNPLRNSDLIENQKGDNAEELNQLLESFDEDSETVVNGDLDAVIRNNSDNLLNAKKDILEKYLISQNLNISIPISGTQTDYQVMKDYEQVNSVLSEPQSCRHFSKKQINNTSQPNRVSPRQEERQVQFLAMSTASHAHSLTTITTTNSPIQFSTSATVETPTATITTTHNTGATPSSREIDLQRADTRPIQFSSIIAPPLHTVSTSFAPLPSPSQHTRPIQFSSAATPTPTTLPTVVSIEQNLESRSEEVISANESRPMKCNFCPERFHAPWQKTFHEKVHFLNRSRRAGNVSGSNEEPSEFSIYNSREFQCKTCGIRISSEERLKGHHEQYHATTANNEQVVEQNEFHSGLRPGYQCELCNAAYKHKKSLKHHIQRRHPETLSCVISKKAPHSTNEQLPSSILPSRLVSSPILPSPHLPLSRTNLSQMHSPRLPSSYMPSPQTLPLHMSSHQLASSRAPSPQITSSQMPSPQLLSSQILSPQLPSLQMPSSQTLSPQLPSLQAPLPQIPSSQMPSPQLPSFQDCSTDARLNYAPVKDSSVDARCVWHLQSLYQPALDTHDTIESFGTLYHKDCVT